MAKTAIIVINEVWFNTNEVNFFKIDYYQHYLNYRDDEEGGLCAVYVRNGIKSNLIKNRTEFNTIIIDIHGDKNNSKLTLITMYRPPRSNIFLEFLEFLEKILH